MKVFKAYHCFGNFFSSPSCLVTVRCVCLRFFTVCTHLTSNGIEVILNNWKLKEKHLSPWNWKYELRISFNSVFCFLR